jgi:glycosyltransferase involved in cell wall biosynthesis
MVVITIIARLLKHKGFIEFLNAAKGLSGKYENVIYIIVGFADEGNPSALREGYINSLRENPRIKFLGKRQDIREILAVTDIYTLPSYREGLPMTVLEAMAMGKSVVTTDVPGCRQAIENNVNGLLVPKKDSVSLRLALEKLIIDKPLRLNMGKASREKAVRVFSDKVVVKEIISLYKTLI